MGAKNCPETPRQKLIGMMYLFLTAMLALNVSRDILNSFIVVNNGLEKTNSTFTERNAYLYHRLGSQNAVNEEKVAPYYNAALEAKKMSEELNAYIHDIKKDLVMDCEGVTEEVADTMNIKYIEAKDNIDIPTYYMVGENVDGSSGKARELKNKLIDYRERLLELLKDEKITFVDKENTINNLGKLGIDTDDPEDVTGDNPEEKYWETSRFYHIPLAAVITMLSQIQSQVKNAETVVVNKLLSSITELDYKFDTLAAKINARSNYLIAGENYEADLFLAAFNKTDNPVILVGSGYDTVNKELLPPIDTVPVNKGLGKYVVESPGVGIKKYAALIRVRTPSNEYKEYPLMVDNSYDIEYTVAQPGAVVSPTSMNVLFKGIGNPLKISVPGFSSDRIRASINNGSLRRTSGGYEANVSSYGNATVTVSVIDDNGNSRNMGRQEFRVKRVPDPIAKVGGRSGGNITKSQLIGYGRIDPVMEDFYFNLSYNIIEYTIVITDDQGFSVPYNVKGNLFNDRVRTLIRQHCRHKNLYFEKIKARGPDGVRELKSIYFKVTS